MTSDAVKTFNLWKNGWLGYRLWKWPDSDFGPGVMQREDVRYVGEFMLPEQLKIKFPDDFPHLATHDDYHPVITESSGVFSCWLGSEKVCDLQKVETSKG